MRVIDLIEDMAATSRRLHLRGGVSGAEIARLTAATLIRPDLSRYLQRSVGAEIADPAERLCAMLVRMGEIARAWAHVCVFHQEFGSGALQPSEEGPSPYSAHYDLSSGAQRLAGRRAATLAQVAGGALGGVSYLSAFAHDTDTLHALASATLQAEPLARATALIVGPSRVLGPWRETAAAPLTHAGLLLHLGEGSYDYVYLVRTDRRDLRL